MLYQNNSKTETNAYGVPLSKYYPQLSLDSVVIGETITLNCDLGDFKKGDVIQDTKGAKSLIVELLKAVQQMCADIETMRATIEKQQETIQELIDNPGSKTVKWPDISNIEGGTADDSGEDGGTDEVDM